MLNLHVCLQVLLPLTKNKNCCGNNMRTGNFCPVFTWTHPSISLEFTEMALILIAATGTVTSALQRCHPSLEFTSQWYKCCEEMFAVINSDISVCDWLVCRVKLLMSEHASAPFYFCQHFPLLSLPFLGQQSSILAYGLGKTAESTCGLSRLAGPLGLR